ncbi:MAG: hypothetical protein WC592_00195 [Candidatus Omnitrophota bacterium]|nr:hypothetical protein [Candidatus Omnitrophota bacterium]
MKDRRIAITFAIVVMLAMTIGCHGRAHGDQTGSITGKIVSIDKMDMAIVVRWFGDYRALRTDEKNISISGKTKVSKGAKPVTFDDLNVGDNVTVTYRLIDFEWPEALTILIKA